MSSYFAGQIGSQASNVGGKKENPKKRKTLDIFQTRTKLQYVPELRAPGRREVLYTAARLTRRTLMVRWISDFRLYTVNECARLSILLQI